MELVMSMLLLLGGVGVFLAGMGRMSSGIQQSAGEGVRSLFNKISGNRFAGYATGIGVTAIVQSSSATSIMTIGLANARILDTKQGASIILGAKVGTTLTAFIFALSGLSKGGFSTGIVFASVAFVGAIMGMIVKTDKQKNFATFLLGFGMLFLGLEVMSMAISGSESNLGAMLTRMFAQDVFKSPILLILIGVIFTCIIQSSTAAIAIYITFLTTGVLDSVDQSFFLVLGANIGTCADGLMASIGTNADGKRIAFFHVITSTIGATVFGIITAIFRQPIVGLFQRVIVRPEWSLAIFNLSYNTIYTLLLLPLLTPLVKLMHRLIKDKPKEKPNVLEFLNPQILQTPVLAVAQMKREIIGMGRRSASNLDIAFRALIDGDISPSATIFEQEYVINELNREISDYLIQLSSVSSSLAAEKAIGTYHHVINDIERIGDHAKNFMVLTRELNEEQAKFTEESRAELCAMYDKVKVALNLSLEIFESRDKKRLPEISALESEIDAMHKNYSKGHFKRLRDRSNWAEIQLYYDIITELERIGDHVVNVAFSILNPTGQESFKNAAGDAKGLKAKPKSDESNKE